MKFENMGKIGTVFFIVGLMVINLYGIEFTASMGSADSSHYPMFNDFQNFKFGGISEQENENYGWNITYIENLNGDNYVDLVLGSPWYDGPSLIDVGAVYIFYGKAGSVLHNLNYSEADVIIRGDIDGDKFGWDIANAGDVNNDGINDLIVGAPFTLNCRGSAYIFHGGSFNSGTHAAKDVAARILNSEELGLGPNALYGSSVAGIGDLNKDNYDEVLVGAPGADKAVITYGFKNKVTIFPNIWDDDPTSNGIVYFNKGVSNTNDDLNTWGLNGDDDGWDWTDSFQDPTDLYGETTPAPYDNANLYAPWESDKPDADGLTWSNRTALEVMIGRNHTDLSPYGSGWDWDPGSSAAWGIEFTITPELYNYISKNSTITLGFDYGAMDANVVYNPSNLSRTFIYTIRSRIWNSTLIDYMGNVIVNNEKYVFYKQDPWSAVPWGPVYNSFEWEITDYIDKPGSYYWDFGCYFDRAWSSRYDDGMMAFFDNITMKIINEKNVIITGVSESGFGAEVESIGDINGDGSPDMLIGAPNFGSGFVTLLYGKEQFQKIESFSQATIVLTGEDAGDKFGYSMANAGDVDNDGIQDVIIGAPGGDYAHLYYGSTLNKVPLVPDLWERSSEKGTPQVEFNSGIKTTGNTPGLSGADDGWDTWNGIYGYESGNTAGSSVKYNNADGLNSEQIAADDELIIAIGGNLGGGSSVGATPDSGAYGVEFSITQNMISTINAGGSALLTYDWSFVNVLLDQDDTIWIKTFIRSTLNDYDLGWDLDQYAMDAENKDDTKEVHWAEIPYSTDNVFIQEISECFQTAGSYYLDIGGKLRNYWWDSPTWEDGVFHFDNVYLRFNPPPDAKFIGQINSSFGFSVGSSSKLNVDNYGDIVIGAPKFDSPNGHNSGAVFGFIMGPFSTQHRLAQAAEFIAYGENSGDNFGWKILGTKSLDSDEFSEIIAAAPKYDTSAKNAGRLYILSISKGPRIRITHPIGGEVLSGNVVVNATVTDPDNNIDASSGVYFYYSTDYVDWKLIGNDPTPSARNNIYEYTWDTTLVPDGTTYYVKGWVRDIKLNIGENITAPLTINNTHPPQLEIKNPTGGSTVQGQVEIQVEAKDSDLDNIGGGIDVNKGVLIYFSNDEVTWELIGAINSSTNDIYKVTLDTTTYTDGEYWLKVNVSDWDGFDVEQIINITIDNPSKPPELELISPLNITEVSGVVILKARAFDSDMDINSSGVTFYVSPDTTPVEWQFIGNDPEPRINSSGAHIYALEWNTATVPDFWYRLRVCVNDLTNLTNESITPVFKVHNFDTNPPVIELISPKGGDIIKETKMITVRVRDIDNNLNSVGINYYYSQDKTQWRAIGSGGEPRVGSIEIYDYPWQTTSLPDGEYWLNVSVTDETGLTSWDTSEEPIFIHNSDKNPPMIKLHNPSKGQHVGGVFTIKVTARDLENNIDTAGVVFHYSADGEEFNVISNVGAPTTSEGNIYELAWDTTHYPDDKYWLKVEATDFDDLKGSDMSEYFYIHNNMNNVPKVKFNNLNSKEISGIVKLNATVFDLEDNINEQGVKFYFSSDNKTWQLINNDPTGKPIGEEQFYYEINWDTSQIPDGIYWLRAESVDMTNGVGSDVHSFKVIVHNNRNNPPKITLKQPRIGVPLSRIQSIIAEVIDFENDVESVSFFYSSNNKDWELIDTVYKVGKDNTYYIMWNTENVYNGKYYIKVVAIDRLGNQGEVTDGLFEVKEGKDSSDENKNDFPYWIIIVIVSIILMVLVIQMVLKRSKRREKELMEEVAVEMLKSRQREGELEPVLNPATTPVPALPPAQGAFENTNEAIDSPSNAQVNVINDTIQTLVHASQAPMVEQHLTDYEPDVETIEYYKAQIDTWKAEGYNVSRLEQLLSTDETMFVRAFPIYSGNISKLKNIASKLNSIDTIGYEAEINSIRSKLYDPDLVVNAENEYNDLKTKLGIAPLAVPCPTQASVPATNNSGALYSPHQTQGQVPGMIPEQDIDELLPQMLPSDSVPPDEIVPEENFEPVPEQPGIPISPYVEGCAHDPVLEEQDFPKSPFSGVQTQSLEDELGGDAEIVEIPEDP